MIPISEAINIIKREITSIESEICDLSNVCGRILAENIFADTDLPPFNRSQMDGFAVKSEDLKNAPVKLKIIGESVAGKRFEGELKTGETVRIMTGAALPVGADSVQRVELSKPNGDFVEIFEPTKLGQFIVNRGSEIKKTEKIFERGEVITKNMLASFAAFGYAKVKVSKRPTVSILATGSEIIPVNKIPKQDEIRDSNSIMLKLLAGKFAEIQNVHLIKDNIESIKSEILNLKSEIVIITGGVSMGDYDFTKPALRELGAEIFFERVSLRPGKPCVFAKLGNTFIFGLPGNPVSVAVTFYLFVRTALLEMQNALQTELRQGFAVLTKAVNGATERDSYLPAKTFTNEKGQLIVEPLRWSGSSDFVSFSRANCLIFIPQGKLFEDQSVVKIVFI
jgi:molybdopterin molybdotransferase